MITASRVIGLDFLRALAVMGVLCSHAINFIPAENRSALEPFIFLPAYLGVELFFVLSGFLIGSILLNPEHTESFLGLRQFWIRRWFRTLPNYYLIMALTLVVILAVGEGALLKTRDFLGLLFLQNFAWPHTAFFGIAWSLCVEEWFYLLFPLGIVLLRKSGVSFLRAFVGMAIIFMILPTVGKVVALHFRPDLNWPAHLWKIVVFRLDAVMYGVLAAYFKKSFLSNWKAWRYPAFLLSALLLGSTLYEFELGAINQLVWFEILFCPLTSLSFALMLPYFTGLGENTFGFATSTIQKTALYSYSIYLLHPLIYEGLNKILQLYSPGLAVRWAFYGLLIVSSWLIAQKFYHYFEKPMMDLRERFTGRRPA